MNKVAGSSDYSGDVRTKAVRIADDGRKYTHEQFRAYYGALADKKWMQAEETHVSSYPADDDARVFGRGSPPGAPPPAAGSAGGDAHLVGQHAPPALPPGSDSVDADSFGQLWASLTPPKAPPPVPQRSSQAQPAAVRRPPLPADPADLPPVVPDRGLPLSLMLTCSDAEILRSNSSKCNSGVKQKMRKFLDDVAISQPTIPSKLVWEFPEYLPWKQYIVHHKHYAEIVGGGLVRAALEFLPGDPDHNRRNQLRLDFVFENVDGVHCRLHPGNTAKDAKPIFTQKQQMILQG